MRNCACVRPCVRVCAFVCACARACDCKTCVGAMNGVVCSEYSQIKTYASAWHRVISYVRVVQADTKVASGIGPPAYA